MEGTIKKLKDFTIGEIVRYCAENDQFNGSCHKCPFVLNNSRCIISNFPDEQLEVEIDISN